MFVRYIHPSISVVIDSHDLHDGACIKRNTTPCPPYNLAPDDMFSAQTGPGMMASAREPTGDSDDIEHIGDPAVLKRLLMEKEQERQQLVANLDLAARLGLGLQQQLEQVEINSYAKLQSLQDQNMMLQSRANQAMELSSQLTGTEDEVNTLTNHNSSLQRELDTCRRDLKVFRKELDGLVEQMTEMGAEVVDAKSKVSSYARRLGEVEQELSTTQEINVNLQVQLESALERQKLSHSNTTQVVKMIQSDLGKVVSESGTIRSTLEELENRQVKCEGKVVEMITNTREYAHLLEEAQDTIHVLRHESDMEGRSWPQGSSSNKKKNSIARSLSTLAQENPELSKGPEDDEELDVEPEQDPEKWNGELETGTNTLGLELGKDEQEQDMDASNDQSWSDNQSMDAAQSEPKQSVVSTPPSSPASYHPMSSSSSTSKQTPANSPRAPALPKITVHPLALPVDSQTQTETIIPIISSQKLSLTAELHQRLEEHSNSLQNTLQPGASRPPWNPSVALENVLTSPNARPGGRSTSQTHMALKVNGSKIGPSGMPSPHMSLSSSTSSLSEAIAGNRARSGASISIASGSGRELDGGIKPQQAISTLSVLQQTPVMAAKAKSMTTNPAAPKKLPGTTAGPQSTVRERTRATTLSGGGDRLVTRRATSDDSAQKSTARNTRAPSLSRSKAPESKVLHSSVSSSALTSSRSTTSAGSTRPQPPPTTAVAFGRQSPARPVGGTGTTNQRPSRSPSTASTSGVLSAVASSGRTTPNLLPRARSSTPPLTSSSPSSNSRTSRPTASSAAKASASAGSRRPSLTPVPPIPELSVPPVPAIPASVTTAIFQSHSVADTA
ncbi:hypothetical protein BG004_001057 [Podila humilis]|nr:hypothetical protein BG004_001057 [Podila humilis]